MNYKKETSKEKRKKKQEKCLALERGESDKKEKLRFREATEKQ